MDTLNWKRIILPGLSMLGVVGCVRAILWINSLPNDVLDLARVAGIYFALCGIGVLGYLLASILWPEHRTRQVQKERRF